MREVNKDLKLHFSKLQQRIDELETRDRAQGYFAAEQPSKRNRRYDSSEEEEEAVRNQSRERPNARHKNDHNQLMDQYTHAGKRNDNNLAMIRRSGTSDKENKRGANLIQNGDAGGMSSIQES